ncbi:MAG: glycosyltransferase family 2 protein [Pseudomonadota bacterium]
MTSPAKGQSKKQPSLLARMEKIWRGKTPEQMRLKGKLWQWRYPLQPSDGLTSVVFGLPLVSKRRAPDWDVVCRNLRRTLASFEAQSDPNWKVVICSQDKPKWVPWSDKITFIQSTVSDKFFDKGDKDRQLKAHVAKTCRFEGYYFRFDADDVAHPDLVSFLMSNNNRAGYTLTRGYCYDLERAEFGHLSPEGNAFNHSCGSSSAAYFDFRHHKGALTVLNQNRSHMTIERNMGYFGFDMGDVPFEAALYLINHGQNMLQRRGRLDVMLDRLEGARIADTEQTNGIKETFGLEALEAIVKRDTISEEL